MLLFCSCTLTAGKCYFLPVGSSQETWKGIGSNAVRREDLGGKGHKSIGSQASLIPLFIRE